MLEVFSAAAGAGIYGAMKGFLAARQATQPGRKFLANSFICLVCGYDIYARAEERGHGWTITGRSNAWVNDSIDSNSPKYFVSNIPLLIGSYALAFTVFGSLRMLASCCSLRFVSQKSLYI